MTHRKEAKSKISIRLIDPDTFSFHLESKERAEEVLRRLNDDNPFPLVGEPYWSEPDKGWYAEFALPGSDAP